MTNQEAIKSMQEGQKVTHRYFESDEYIYLDQKGNLRDEKGYHLDSKVFWMLRDDEFWRKSWSIYGA